MRSFLTHLECARCGAVLPADRLSNLCPACRSPLLARYDLAAAREAIPRRALADRVGSLWRYVELLPVADPAWRLTLGEGWTPLLRTPRLGDAVGLPHLLVKDEGLNPTGSFKARGLVMAVARAGELGAQAVALPSAGNAGAALGAYAARAGLPAHVYVPADVPPLIAIETRMLGAHVTLVDGLITDCARHVKAGVAEGRWFDCSTLAEPYRIEGKKTMGYELAEQLGWELPDVVVYPTGGGTGLVGMWKAFDEMEALGWIGAKRPRMVSVQSSGCAPIVRAWETGADRATPWEGAATVAPGLRVPSAIGDFIILKAIRESRGCAIAVDDADIMAWLPRIGQAEGLFTAPESAATVVAAATLAERGWIRPEERVVLYFTGNGLKYEYLLQDTADVTRHAVGDIDGASGAAAVDGRVGSVGSVGR